MYFERLPMNRYIGHNEAVPKFASCVESDHSMMVATTVSRVHGRGCDQIFSCSAIAVSPEYTLEYTRSGGSSLVGLQNSLNGAI